LLTFLLAVGALRHPVPATHTVDDLLQMPPRPGVVVTGLDRAGSAGMLPHKHAELSGHALASGIPGSLPAKATARLIVPDESMPLLARPT